MKGTTLKCPCDRFFCPLGTYLDGDYPAGKKVIVHTVKLILPKALKTFHFPLMGDPPPTVRRPPTNFDQLCAVQGTSHTHTQCVDTVTL